MVTHAKRVEDGLERLVDDMDTFFKTEMEETEHQPFLPPLTPKESRHTTDDPTETHNTSFHSTSQAPLADDEYGLIRTGSKGPKQTPNGTVVFIIFAVTFILLLTAFLVAFMMNVLH